MAESFYYYSQIEPASYSLTVEIDVTKSRKHLKSKYLKFFPTYLYIVSKVLNNHKEFRVGLKDNTLGYYKYIHPAFPQFHKDDKTTSLLWLNYCDDFNTFYNNYINDTKKFGNDHGILTSKGIPPKNTFIISCIPWFSFSDFSLHNHGIKDYYFPSFEASKFIESNNKIIIPLSITVHHATIDGYHIKEFLEDINELINTCENWIKI